MKNTRRSKRPRPVARKGNIVILTAVLMISLMAFVAFAVDLGYMYTVRAELQRSADAAAIAAAWELLDEQTRIAGGSMECAAYQARSFAADFAGKNQTGGIAPALAYNDVTVGHRNNIYDLNEPISLVNRDYNTVRVQVRRDSNQNGEVPLFFAPALGVNSAAMQAHATAALLTGGFKGFGVPPDGKNVQVLPFALDLKTWREVCDGTTTDDKLRWDEKNRTVTDDSGDGIVEFNLYPQGIDSAGNRGTVDIGSLNNSTADICRQITDGLCKEDLAHHGGCLEFDSSGELPLNGDTGISASVKDDLVSILGETRIIPVFQSVEGNGENVSYTIVQWVGVRIMEVKLTGPMKNKRVIVQPACVFIRGAVPADEGTHPSSFVYSPVVLVE